MSIAYEIRRRARLIVGPVLGISLCAYFAYHLVQGDRGLTAWLRLTQQVRDARTTLAAVEAERSTLERRGHLPPPHPPHRRKLDERARSQLHLAAADHMVGIQQPTGRV